MKLSILDQSIVPVNGDRQQALQNTIETAQLGDALGYTRIWVAEHHAAGTAAGRTPEVLMPVMAAQTENIKVGSGAVLLNHYSPFKVAETFNTLEELFPGRIDMGIGRATTGPLNDFALQRSRQEIQKTTDDSEQQIDELLHWMNQDFDTQHPFSSTKSYNNGSTPQFWLLGSSRWSAPTAAKRGLPYAFAGFINPAAMEQVSQAYHDNFEPAQHQSGVQEPQLMITLNVFVAETVEEAQRLSAPFQLFGKRLQTTGDIHSLMQSEDEAMRILGRLPAPVLSFDPKQPPKILIGTPELMQEWLPAIAAAHGSNEIMLHTATANHEARLKSYELLGQAVNLKANTIEQLVN